MANVNFKSIDFDYYNKNEHETHSENLEKRYSKEQLQTTRENTTVLFEKIKMRLNAEYFQLMENLKPFL